ncbi:MAG: hypothetical protein EOP56_11170 [Sphingobacteriales bacterium]|nr:MAG: hypothetical protein EOP56_11170 [Sphingobacteriales bacterium]
MNRLYNIARYLAAFFIMFYGFAKLNGAQFTVIESELDKPMREVSGFWLTWYYFGYSWFYGNIIAVLQIVSGIGLLFRRTTLIAALVLLSVMGNILMVDYFFSIPMQGSAMAVVITVLLLIVLARHKHDLIAFFWKQQPDGNKSGIGNWILRIAIVVVPALFTHYVANVNNRRPTPLDGTWTVKQSVASGSEFDSLQRIYFERNRAFMAVFKYPNSWQQHQFVVAGDTLTITKGYMTNGTEKLKATYKLSNDGLNIVDLKRGISLRLKKR